MKATRKGLLGRLVGRKVKAVDVLPVVTDDVPAAELSVGETVEFLLLGRAIDRADHTGAHAGTRRAALQGMNVLAERDPKRMQAIIAQVGSMGATPLRAAIMELAAVGRAQA